MNDHVTDEMIESTLDHNPDEQHSEEDVRYILEQISESVEHAWGEWMDNIADGDAMVVAETSDLILVDAGERNPVSEELELNPNIKKREFTSDIITQIMHDMANEIAPDRRWPATYPFVLVKPDDFDAGQDYVGAVMNGLQKEGLSPGQAWAYYGVEIRGNSMNSWGRRKGDSDHKNVSDALSKAKQKMPW